MGKAANSCRLLLLVFGLMACVSTARAEEFDDEMFEHTVKCVLDAIVPEASFRDFLGKLSDLAERNSLKGRIAPSSPREYDWTAVFRGEDFRLIGIYRKHSKSSIYYYILVYRPLSKGPDSEKKIEKIVHEIMSIEGELASIRRTCM